MGAAAKQDEPKDVKDDKTAELFAEFLKWKQRHVPEPEVGEAPAAPWKPPVEDKLKDPDPDLEEELDDESEEEVEVKPRPEEVEVKPRP